MRWSRKNVLQYLESFRKGILGVRSRSNEALKAATLLLMDVVYDDRLFDEASALSLIR